MRDTDSEIMRGKERAVGIGREGENERVSGAFIVGNVMKRKQAQQAVRERTVYHIKSMNIELIISIDFESCNKCPLLAIKNGIVFLMFCKSIQYW